MEFMSGEEKDQVVMGYIRSYFSISCTLYSTEERCKLFQACLLFSERNQLYYLVNGLTTE